MLAVHFSNDNELVWNFSGPVTAAAFTNAMLQANNDGVGFQNASFISQSDVAELVVNYADTVAFPGLWQMPTAPAGVTAPAAGAIVP